MKPTQPPPSTMSTPPQPSSAYDVEAQLLKTRKELEKCFKDFHELLKSKVLTTNKSNAAKLTEKDVVDKLVRTCAALDQINYGEGLLSLSIIAIREHLKIRDRVNFLEYELELLRREVKQMKKEVPPSK